MHHSTEREQAQIKEAEAQRDVAQTALTYACIELDQIKQHWFNGTNPAFVDDYKQEYADWLRIKEEDFLLDHLVVVNVGDGC
jgi:hypothetical protein